MWQWFIRVGCGFWLGLLEPVTGNVLADVCETKLLITAN